MNHPARPALAIATILFACLAYVPGLNGPFIHDDFTNLALVLVPVDSWQQALDAILSNGSGVLRRPLANASLLANHILFGASPFTFKAVALVFHGACGAVILATGIMVARARNTIEPNARERIGAGLSLAVAMIWLAHPLGISTVLYVVQRMTILSALFSLCALWWFARGFAGGRLWASIAGFYISTALAIASKESGALTPVYALALTLLLGHGHLRQAFVTHRALLTYCIILPGVAGVALLLFGFEYISSGYESRPFSLAERLSSESAILWKYMGTIILPVPQWMHFFQDDAPILDPLDYRAIAATAAWLLAAVFAAYRYRSTPWPAFAIAWYLGGHLMESSIIALDLAYEHRNYLPMLGPLAALAATAQRILSNWAKVPLRTATLLFVSCLMVATASRAYTWSSLPRLITHELSVAPTSLRAQYYGYFLAMTRQDWEKSEHHLGMMRNLTDDAGWIETNVLVSRCQGNPYTTIDERTKEAIVSAATDTRTRRGMQQVVSLTTAGSCQLDLGLDVRSFVALLGQTAEEAGEKSAAADYYYMASSLAWSAGDLPSSAALLSRSASLAPDDSRPAEQLIVVQLALGNFTAATSALEQANRAWTKHEPWRKYRYARWSKEIEEVRTQAREGHSPPST